jgi:hypothetical protein
MRTPLLAAAAFAAACLVMPVAAQPPGSPHETVNATVDGAKVSIEYGRPYARGRKIVGGLVPYGRVWRTGADQATTLTTDAPLVIGGAKVPAGTVTTRTLSSPVDQFTIKLDGGKLVLAWELTELSVPIAKG